jgi:4-diphosphocytidyl-2-C-methyl-D-erythritol kinase
VDPKILQALRSGDADALSRVLVNDLQRASIELAPSLRDTLGIGESHGAIAGIVSGSGPTVALLTHNPSAAEGLAEDLQHYGLTAIAVHGPVHGARIISDTLL